MTVPAPYAVVPVPVWERSEWAVIALSGQRRSYAVELVSPA
ncbi:hypothetical protein ACFCXS_08965 [Streptomyces sp. NPDC056373]